MSDTDPYPDLDAIQGDERGHAHLVPDDDLSYTPCGALTRRGDGPPCRRAPAKGQKRCRLHGGASPQAIAKAERVAHQQKLERDIERALAKFDIQPVTDPLTALQLLAGEVLEWKRILLEKVSNLETWRYSTDFSEQIRGEILLYERAIDRAVNVLGTIARLNIEERLTAVTEAQAARLEGAMFDAFEIVGIPITDPELRERVLVAFADNVIRLPQAG